MAGQFLADRRRELSILLVDRAYPAKVVVVLGDLEHPEIWGFTPEALRDWWRSEVPLMRATLEPGTEDFDRAFGDVAEAAAAVEPQEIPLGWSLGMEFRHTGRIRYSGTQQLLTLRLNDTDGSFLGALRLSWPALYDSYALQATTNLNLPVVWADATNAVTLLDTNPVVMDSATGMVKFYQLRRP